MKFLIIFIFLISKAIANETPNIKNLVVHEKLKTHENITFLDTNKRPIKLSDYKGNLVILNFWATWCAPCREEMPSLDDLKENPFLKNIKIFPINIGNDNKDKIHKFFEDTKIENLEIFYDNPVTLAKKFSLRGVPTTIIFNKDGKEFARIMGSIDFLDKNFIDWIKIYN
tara:strand:- start:33 stop:542 length:510 start_codon:yes stop_codon:yes gene_type:complete